MSNDLVKAASGNLPPAVITDKELLSHLENLGLLPKLTAGEKNTYLQIAKAFNLNPFKREIHVSKYGDQMSIITGYEVYIKRAERTGQLDGWSVVTEGQASDKTLKAIITIYRKDRAHPFVWEVLYSEYAQFTKEGAVTKFWKKPITMIKKVAMSQGFRLCFNDELGGMPYGAEELGVEDASFSVEPPGEEMPNPVTTGKVTIPAANTQAPAAPPIQFKDGKPVITNEQFKKLGEKVKAGDLEAYTKGVSFFSFDPKQRQTLDDHYATAKAAQDAQPK